MVAIVVTSGSRIPFPIGYERGGTIQYFPGHNVMYSIVRGSTSGDDQRCACHTDQDPQLSGSLSLGVFGCVLIFLGRIFFFCYFQGYLMSLHFL